MTMPPTRTIRIETPVYDRLIALNGVQLIPSTAEYVSQAVIDRLAADGLLERSSKILRAAGKEVADRDPASNTEARRERVRNAEAA